MFFFKNKSGKLAKKYISHLVGGELGLLHPVPVLQLPLECLVRIQAGIGGAGQGEELPQNNAVAPNVGLFKFNS